MELPKLINNITERVIDDLKSRLSSKSKLSIAAASFSIYAFEALKKETDREDFRYVVPDFRLNKAYEKLNTLTKSQKDKVEFLCNECCYFGCKDRKECYEAVSRRNLGEEPDFSCTSPGAEEGYRFSKVMKNPGFISVGDIQKIYLPMGCLLYTSPSPRDS